MFKFTIMTLAPTAVLGMENNGAAGLSAAEPDNLVNQMTGDKCATETKPYPTCDDFAEDRTVVLVAQEGKEEGGVEGVDFITVNANTAGLSELVKTMIQPDDECASVDEETGETTYDQNPIPLPNVKINILTKVVEFMKYFNADKVEEGEWEELTPIAKPLKSSNMHEVVPKWYAEFVEVEQDVLFELILAANYMDIKPLLDLTCASVASMIKGKTPEDIRKTFNVVAPPQEPQAAAEEK